MLLFFTRCHVTSFIYLPALCRWGKNKAAFVFHEQFSFETNKCFKTKKAKPIIVANEAKVITFNAGCEVIHIITLVAKTQK